MTNDTSMLTFERTITLTPTEVSNLLRKALDIPNSMPAEILILDGAGVEVQQPTISIKVSRAISVSDNHVGRIEGVFSSLQPSEVCNGHPESKA